MTSPEQPNKQGKADGGASNDDARRAGTPSSDFGSFVSSSVRSSFRQLKRESTLSGASTEKPQPSSPRSSRRSRQRDTRETPDAAQQTRSGPVGRKWRDAIAPPESRQSSDDDQDEEDPGGELQASGFDVSVWFRETFFDENGPTRKLFAAIAAIIVIILIVIFLFSLGGDGNGGDEVTPTATEENVLTTDRTSTPSSSTETTVTDEAQTPTTEPTVTEEDFEGGDNQRN